MKTIVIPTDFSEAAKHAALYAIELAKQIGVTRLVIYHSYEYLNLPDPLMGYEGVVMTDKVKSDEALPVLKDELQTLAGDIQVDAYHSGETLELGIQHMCEMSNADLIIMGSKGGGKFKEVLVGSNTIKVAQQLTVPVIIIPPGVVFTKIEEVVLAWDFRKVEVSIPIAPIKMLLDATRPKLFVLNITHDKSVDDKPADTSIIDSVLDGYDPQYHFIHNEDFIEAMNDFAEAKAVDLIIAIPKKHGWFDRLLNKSHTRRLAFHSHVPLMIVHD